VLEVPCSPHIIQHAYGWSVEEAIERSIESSAAAHRAGLSVTFFPVDGTRAGSEMFNHVISRVAGEGWIDSLGLVDTFGVLSPHAVPYMVEQARRVVAVPLEAHFHMDMSLGVANSLIAVASGAEVIHTTVSGIGERAGNTPLEEVVVALRTQYGIDVGVSTSELYELSQFVLERSGASVAANRPIVGKKLFNVQSGVVTAWMRRSPDSERLSYMPFLPKFVGQNETEIVLGKLSGKESIRIALERHGYADAAGMDDDRIQTVLGEVKRRALAGRRTIDVSELLSIAGLVRDEGPQQPPRRVSKAPADELT
jgi:isopropylmalate/homocitrate/citramalate synthase